MKSYPCKHAATNIPEGEPLMQRGLVIALLLMALATGSAQQSSPASRLTYLGFDRNDYPGDANLSALAQDFRYTSYWLNAPPTEKLNTWAGKRAILKQHGFGFLVLFNGRQYAELMGKDAAAMGTADGKAAVAAANKEGFPAHVLIFLDQEEGGRLYPEQLAYIFAWADAVRAAGARAGVYCSGVEVPDGRTTISTASDIQAYEHGREALTLWVNNEQCPPSPGCATPNKDQADLFLSQQSGAAIWQYAVSPRRPQFSTACPKNNDPDTNCYAPGLPHNPGTYVDLNIATTPDPSNGR